MMKNEKQWAIKFLSKTWIRKKQVYLKAGEVVAVPLEGILKT